MQYKILIVKNRYKKSLKLDKGLEWFINNTPTGIVVEEITTDFSVDSIEKITNATLKENGVWGQDIYDKLKTVVPEGKYHCIVVVVGNDLGVIRPHGYTPFKPLYTGTDLIQLFKVDDKGVALNHEIFHTFIHRLQRQQVMVEDPMDTVVFNGNKLDYFNNNNLNAKPSNRSIALDRIAPYWDKIANIVVLCNPTQYIYFKPSEVVGLKPELVAMLDKARGIAGVPFKITSGYRTEAQNALVGGVEGSSHTKGLAVDLLVADEVAGGKILLALAQAGFKRFGFYKDGHIHCDIDTGKPNPCYWVK